MDAGFANRLNFVRTRIAAGRGVVKVELKDVAALVAAEGGEQLKSSSWSQIFGLKQPLSVRNAIALCRLADVPVGWLLANEGKAPEGYTGPANPQTREPPTLTAATSALGDVAPGHRGSEERAPPSLSPQEQGGAPRSRGRRRASGR